MKTCKVLLSFLWAQSLFPHAPNKHAAHHAASDSQKEKLIQVNELYLQTVKPIFASKCMDCHSTNTQHPWYHKVPGIKQLMDQDIKDGLSHVDMTDDFPFKSHSSPIEDLEAIKIIALKNTMPPRKYTLMHPGSKLTSREKKVLKDWADKGLKILQQEERNGKQITKSEDSISPADSAR